MIKEGIQLNGQSLEEARTRKSRWGNGQYKPHSQNKFVWELCASQPSLYKRQSGVIQFLCSLLPNFSFLIARLVIAGTEFSFGWMARFTEVSSTVKIDCGNEEVNVYLKGR